MHWLALVLVLEPSKQIIWLVLSRNPVNDEKRETSVDSPLPQHPSLLGICLVRGTPFIGLLRTLRNSLQMLVM